MLKIDGFPSDSIIARKRVRAIVGTYLVKFRPKVGKHPRYPEPERRKDLRPWGDIKAIWLTDMGYVGDYRGTGLNFITDDLAKSLLAK